MNEEAKAKDYNGDSKNEVKKNDLSRHTHERILKQNVEEQAAKRRRISPPDGIKSMQMNPKPMNSDWHDGDASKNLIQEAIQGRGSSRMRAAEVDAISRLLRPKASK